MTAKEREERVVATQSAVWSGIDSVVNPWRACAARVTVVVPLVCLPVSVRYGTTGMMPAHKQYQQLERNKCTKINVVFLIK